MRFRPSFLLAAVLAVGLSASTLSAIAQNSSQLAAPALQTEKISVEKISIDKIDPPDWFAAFPDPMLLLHGTALNHAQFSIQGAQVKIERTQSSSNGHWAFLWLNTKNAPAQTLTIVATHGSAVARATYTLAARQQAAAGHVGFGPADAMYLIMPDRFADGAPNPVGDDRRDPRGWHGGDLAGIEAHLDYLHALGITAVWTTPVLSNAHMQQSYHGYAATDLYAVDEHLGTVRSYRVLSDALHARGMKLVIDLVPNHVGVSHAWMDDPPAPNWFHGTRAEHLNVVHDFLPLIDPHAASAASAPTTQGWFTNDMPDLNQSNPLVEQYFIQNALWWVETANLDGIRLDTLPYVERSYWRDFDAALHGVYPHLTMVGEVFHRDPQVVSFFAGDRVHAGIDTGLDTPFDFPLQFALRDVLAADKPMTELADVLRQDALYPHPERLVTFIGNHDTTRFLTEAGGSVARLKLAIGLIATLRGMPQFYSGDEIAMAGGADPDNRHDFPGGFATDQHSAFVAAERTPMEADVLGWTRGLLALRSTHAEFAQGIEQNLFVDADGFAFVRAQSAAGCPQTHADERMLVVVNKAHAAKTIELPTEGTALQGCTQFDAVTAAPGKGPVESAGRLRIEVPAESMAIYSVY